MKFYNFLFKVLANLIDFVVVSGIFLKITFSSFLLLVCRNAVDFCIWNLCLSGLPNYSDNLLVDFLGIFSNVGDDFLNLAIMTILSFSIHMPFFSY